MASLFFKPKCCGFAGKNTDVSSDSARKWCFSFSSMPVRVECLGWTIFTTERDRREQKASSSYSLHVVPMEVWTARHSSVVCLLSLSIGKLWIGRYKSWFKIQLSNSRSCDLAAGAYVFCFQQSCRQSFRFIRICNCEVRWHNVYSCIRKRFHFI